MYALMEIGDFPKPVDLGSMSVAWLECEVNDWMRKRIAARDETPIKRLQGKKIALK